MANEILRELQIDVAKENTFQAILAKQYDKATRYILAEITNLGKPLAIETGSAVLINFSRPDKSTAAFVGEVIGGKVKVPLPYWALELDGEVIADISLVGTDSRLTTLGFTILVQPATYTGDSISEDENFDLLLQLLGQVGESQAAAQAAEQSAVNSANAAASAAQSAQSAQSAAETSAQSASVSATNAASAEQSATAANNTATQAAQSAQSAEQAATTAQQSAENSATNASASAEDAEKAKLAAEQSAQAAANAEESAANAAETLSKAATDLEHAEEVINKAEGIFDGFTVQNTPAPNAIPQYNDKSNIKTSKPIADNDCVRLADIVSLIQKGGIETGLTDADGEEITDENGETLFGYIKFNNA